MAEDIGFGIDVSTLNGPDQVLDDTFTEINSIQILGEDVYRATYCPSAPAVIVDDAPPAPLMFWETPYQSFDLHDRLNDTVGAAEQQSIAGAIEAIYEADNRFDRGVRADVTFDAANRTLRAAVRGTASGIPLQVVLTVDSNQVTFEAA